MMRNLHLNGNALPLMDNHKWDEEHDYGFPYLLGHLTRMYYNDDDGWLWGTAKLNISTEQGRRAYEDIINGRTENVSLGLETKGHHKRSLEVSLVKDPDFKNARLISCHSNSNSSYLLLPLSENPPIKLFMSDLNQQQQQSIVSQLGPGVGQTKDGKYMVADVARLQEVRQMAAKIGINPADVIQSEGIVDPMNLEGFDSLNEQEQSQSIGALQSENRRLQEQVFTMITEKQKQEILARDEANKKAEQEHMEHVAKLAPKCNKVIQAFEQNQLMEPIKDKQERQQTSEKMASYLATPGNERSAGIIFSLQKAHEIEVKKRKTMERELSNFKKSFAMQQSGIQPTLPPTRSSGYQVQVHHRGGSSSSSSSSHPPNYQTQDDDDVFTKMYRQHLGFTNSTPLNYNNNTTATSDKRQRVVNPSVDAAVELHSRFQGLDTQKPPTRQEVSEMLYKYGRRGQGRTRPDFRKNNLFALNPELGAQLYADHHSGELVQTNMAAGIMGAKRRIDNPNTNSTDPLWTRSDSTARYYWNDS